MNFEKLNKEIDDLHNSGEVVKAKEKAFKAYRQAESEKDI